MNSNQLRRKFLDLSIRTKIILGILATGGTALAIFAALGTFQTRQITNLLSDRLETSVSLLAEEQLINRANEQAELVNQSFSDVSDEVEGLAAMWASLQKEKDALGLGIYWDGQTKLIQMEDGRYGNPIEDTSSIYVPANLEMDTDVMEDVNTSAHLDFYAPRILDSQSSLLAVYAIDTRGITRYYPNINLASLLPPGFDATQRPYYEITSPLFNPQRQTRWTIPYVDATGGGLVVTMASPIYVEDEFNGVVAADMQLSEITEQVQELKIGETGYAFLIDDAGRIISMPPAGYELFGLDPNSLNNEEYFKQTLFGLGTDQLQSVVRRMAAGGNGLQVVDAGGTDTYISYAPIRANGYSLAMVVPVSELQGAIITAQREARAQINTGTRVLVISMIALLFISILISLTIGNVISAPIVRLTEVSNQIVGGDLSAKADIDSQDEIGTLARAFDTMTTRLRELLQGLETRVEERTNALAGANEKNERRAKQFENISQVAATISSTRDLDTLLPQITNAISTKFGFYHTGIFLLDSRGEYAVLCAANSEGGKRMLARNHRLRVGETGIVGHVTGTGKARVALNTGQDAVFFNNPDLPETHSEIALPLKDANGTIGALDVQSTEVNAFDQEDINILTALADQVSIAIQNAQQYEETQKALAESLSASHQFVHTGWQEYVRTQRIVGVRHSGIKTELLYVPNGDAKKEDASAMEQMNSVNRTESTSLPIKLHGVEIGTVDVRSNDYRGLDPDELDIVNAIIERAAIAMENARLLQEAQRQTLKEQKIGEMTSKIGASINLRNVLQTAVEELGRALPGSEVVIQIAKTDEKR